MVYGLEISYELPRQQWPREERIFAADMVNRGRFPGPWDADMARAAAGGGVIRWALAQGDRERMANGEALAVRWPER